MTDNSIDERITTRKREADFTDILWEILAGNVHSFSELCNALLYVFESIQAEDIRPYLFSSNKTYVAKIVREIMKSGNLQNETTSMFINSLTHTDNDAMNRLPLQMLVEIGLEKLKRDCFQSLLSSSVAEREHLEPFMIESDSPHHSIKQFEQAITNIEKLLYVKTLLELCQMYFASNEILHQHLIRKALQELINNTVDSNFHQFRLDISTDLIYDNIRKMLPTSWKCSFENKSEGILNESNCGIVSILTTSELTIDKPFELACDVPSNYENSLNSSDIERPLTDKNVSNKSAELSQDDDSYIRNKDKISYYQVVTTAIKRLVPNFKSNEILK